MTLIFFFSLILGILTTWGVLRRGGLASDIPNSRSSHSFVTPRGGGIAFLLTTVLVFILWKIKSGFQVDPAVVLLCFGAACGLLGIVEDIKAQPAWLRLLVECFFAGGMIFAGFHWSLPLAPSLFSKILNFGVSLLWYLWVINLYNFMDGINGIATLVGISLCILFALLAHLMGATSLMMLLVILAGALAGFLFFNFPHSRIFMGDAGSLFLGAFFGAVPIFIHQREPTFSVWLGILALAPFFFDALITLLIRLWYGENLFTAHRSHFYQRLSDLLDSHTLVSLIYLSWSFLFGSVVLRAFLVRSNDTLLPSLGSLGSLFLFFGVIRVYHHKMNHRNINYG